MRAQFSGISVRAVASKPRRFRVAEAIKRVGVLLALTGLVAGNAWAGPPGWPHHPSRSSVQFGVYIGAPWGYPPPVYWPHVYVPPVAPVVVVPPPPVYVEQPRMPAPEPVPVLVPGYWYYCNEAQAYYPYVKQCPGGWQQVAPHPAQ